MVMVIKQVEFQQRAITDLVGVVYRVIDNVYRHRTIGSQLTESERKCLFVSSVASGKTYMSGQVMDRLVDKLNEESLNPNNKFHDRDTQPLHYIFISPGTGGLNDQSYNALKSYPYKNIQVRDVQDIIQDGFSDLDCLVINWEKVKSDGNVLRRVGETPNLIDRVNEALLNNGQFIVFIDEEHLGTHTDLSQEFLGVFGDVIKVAVTATPKDEDVPTYGANKVIVPMEEVINAQFIKEKIIVNNSLVRETGERGLLVAAKEQQEILRNCYREEGLNVTPLVLVQIENATDKQIGSTANEIKEILRDLGVSESKIAIKTAKEETDNYADIVNNNVEYLIFKQAVTTGWDVPRAHILVRLRDTKSKAFTLQTLGRILRTIEKKYYVSEPLNKAYLYTDRLGLEYTFAEHEKNLLIEDDGVVKDSKTPIKPHYKLSKTYLYRDVVKDTQRQKVRGQVKQIFDKHFSGEHGSFVLSGSTLSKKIQTGEVDTQGLTGDGLFTQLEEAYLPVSLAELSSTFNILKNNYNRVEDEIFKLLVQKLRENKPLGSVEHYEYKVYWEHKDIINTLLALVADEVKQLNRDQYVQKEAYRFPETILYSSLLPDDKSSDNYLYKRQPKTNGLSNSEPLFAEWLVNNADEWVQNKTGDDGFRVTYQEDGKYFGYYPDFIFIKNNKLYIIDVKSPFNAPTYPDVQSKFEAGKEFERINKQAILGQQLDKEYFELAYGDEGLMRYNWYLTLNSEEPITYDDFVVSIARLDTKTGKFYILDSDGYTDDFNQHQWVNIDEL